MRIKNLPRRSTEVGSRKFHLLNKPASFSLLVCLCLGSPFVASSALAQQVAPAASIPAPALPNPATLAPKFDGNYLTEPLVLRPLRATYTASPLWRGYYFETLATDESFLGNYSQAISDFDAGYPVDPEDAVNNAKSLAADKVLLRSYTAVDARQAIFTAATHRQAVFINEAHHVPMDRAFTLSLLRGLYAEGFRYFAAETLAAKDTDLQKRGYPTLNTGYYTREPVFGDLIRTAIKIGYKVVPYEYEGARLADPIAAQNQRERGEAQNLYDRIFKSDPKAKVLVHAGYGHIAKIKTAVDFTPGAITSKTASGSVTFMALWFQQITKIVPLCIDQTYMMERSDTGHEHSAYQAAVAENLLQSAPIVLKNKSQQYLVPSADNLMKVDMMVFHPPVQYEFGRPTWLSEEGQRQAYVLPDDLGVPATTSVLVQAFYENEPPATAIPIDQVELLPGVNLRPALMLPVGRFHLRVVNGAGQVLREWHIDRTGATP